MKFPLLILGLLLSLPLAAQESTVIAFEMNEVKAVEDGKYMSVSILRMGNTVGEATVQVTSRDGSAEDGKDYEAVSLTLVFRDGESAKTVSVKVIDDKRFELPESFTLELSNPSQGVVLGEKDSVPVRIAMIKNDAVVLGLLMALLGLVFATSKSEHPTLRKFYKYVPALLVCYFLPSVLSTLGIVSPDHSQMYYMSSRYLLPACLVLLCLSIDLEGVMKLGPKALIMFFTGTLGIVLGGPLAFLIVGAISPETIGGEGLNATWRGMTTVAGSWIGGGANQTAMKEIFDAGDGIFSAMIAVDIIVANIWMAFLLFAAGDSDNYDKKLKADNSAIKALQVSISEYQASIAKIPDLTDLMKLAGIAFAATGVAHFCADIMSPTLASLDNDAINWLGLTSKFFWLIVVATGIGFALSFTRFRAYEGVGASRLGSGFLYVLIASIGMKMDLTAIFHQPGLFVVGLIWIAFHAVLLILVAKLIRAPLFFMAVGSQANVGGAASAPVVASAFHPSLAPVGVLLAVFGYFIGTFAAWGCGLLLKLLAGA